MKKGIDFGKQMTYAVTQGKTKEEKQMMTEMWVNY
jgi:hypothetical protein